MEESPRASGCIIMKSDAVAATAAPATLMPIPTPRDRRAALLVRLPPILRDFPRSCLAGGIGSGLLAVYVAWTLDQTQQSLLPPMIWWAAYTLQGVWPIVVVKCYTRGPQTDEALLSAAQKLVSCSLLAGFVWGTSSWVMLPTSSSHVASFVALGHAMVLMAVVNTLANDRRMALGFVVPATLMFISGLFRLGEVYYSVLGFGFLIFTGALLTFAKAQEETISELVHLRLETARLLEERTAQQREAEALRRQAEDARGEAERANLDKTRFLAAAGHDLRQPMHALVLYHGHMHRLNHQSSLMETIESSAKALTSMKSLLDSILEASQLLTGSVKPVSKHFSIAPMLDRLDAQMRPQAQAKGLAYQMTVRADKVVYSDEVLLERILRNLIANAIRYTNRGKVLVDVCIRKEALLLRVADTGIGIPREDRARIFQPFVQVSSETRARRKGLGLGLAVVAELSKLLEVDVGLRSSRGRGSIFSVRLPFADDLTPMLDTQKALSPYRPSAAGTFAVVIDDEEESLQAMASALRLLGCKVMTAASSAQAIKNLSRQELMPELIVSDYHLADELGPDAVAAITQAQRMRFGAGLGIATLLVTGDPALVDVEGSALASRLPVLIKPVSLEALNAAVAVRLSELAAGCLED